MSTWQASWIWLESEERRPRNQAMIARKRFTVPAVTAATLAITADTRYRLYINGEWVEDGPCRSWPAHYQYDVIDVAKFLHPGENVIVVEATYFGFSTFHQIPQEAGLLAQLTITTADGQTLTIGTDERWRAIEKPGHERQTTRISIQQGSTEWYDATRELSGVYTADFDDNAWPYARAYHAAEAGPWGDLHPRDVRFLSREPLFPQRVYGAEVVTGCAHVEGIDLKRLAYPHDTSSNIIPISGVLATHIRAETAQRVRVSSVEYGLIGLYLDGKPAQDMTLELTPGDHLLTVTACCTWGHMLMSTALGFERWDGLSLRNPIGETATPWLFIGPYGTVADTSNVAHTTIDHIAPEVTERLNALATAPTADALLALAGSEARPVPADALLRDSYLSFMSRAVVRAADDLITDRAALLADHQHWTTIAPSADGDIELCLDFGTEIIGYVEFELDAPAGTIVDVNLIEYRNGKELQFPGRNGFRYITRDGVNHFISAKRRAGRYLFLTLRNMTAPVRVRTVKVLQATYPVEWRGRFRCADPLLDRIWQMSAYTLQLCMEDTYTDCPLYEQTLWVGDARNESLYNAICFGADDITLRCLRLTAQSLDTLPITGCQVPSGWDILLPAWSFQWGINVWDYYFGSGDRDGLAELYPYVMKNLRGAHAYCTDHGLFSITAWNLFDWAGVDMNHRTVLYNSLFLIAAIDAARQCCAVLGEADEPWLAAFRAGLVAAVLAYWDAEKGSYPDCLYEDGTISPYICQHNSALALLYDVLPEGADAIVHRHLVDPPAGMTKIGSPFALQYVMEALEKVGDAGTALRLIREGWQPMLEHGATTCWETFPGWEKGMLTRSHCHAWSSTPVYVFNRSILGIMPVAPGAIEVVVSPHPLELTWAEGASASPLGDLAVAWRKDGDTLSITVNMPEGVAWRVEANADWAGLTAVLVNGEARPDLVPACV